MDVFFDYLNVKNSMEHKLKRKEAKAPYRKASDWRFKVLLTLSCSIFCTPHYNLLLLQWLREDFLGYLSEWEQECLKKPLKRSQSRRQCLSRETLEGLRITGMLIAAEIIPNPCILTIIFNTVTSFCELAPKLISGGQYLLSEVFCQDPLERYFSKQRHRGGGNDDPTVTQFNTNSAILMQRQQVRSDLTTVNVEPSNSASTSMASAYEPLPKRRRREK